MSETGLGQGCAMLRRVGGGTQSAGCLLAHLGVQLFMGLLGSLLLPTRRCSHEPNQRRHSAGSSKGLMWSLYLHADC